MLNSKVISFIRESGVDLKGRKLLCCVSGGADSMALLHHFHTNSSVYGLEDVIACHYNHSMRGEESLSDEILVTDFCCQHDIQLITDRLEIHFDLDHVDHSENTLRKLRYQFFENSADAIKADFIVTAHNMNDNAETVLFRIARGTGLRGMSGIPIVRGRILRPFLCVNRAEIEEYCEENEIPFVTDSSNLQDDYKRNLIRHRVMTVMTDINKDFLHAINNIAEISSQADHYFVEEADRIIRNGSADNSLSRESVLNAKPPLNEYLIMRFLSGKVKELSRESVERILEIIRSTGKTEISEKCYFIVDSEKCYLQSGYDPVRFGPVPFDKLNEYYPQKRFEFIGDLIVDENHINDLFYSCVDYDKLNGEPQIRNRRNGDRFSSAYRGNTKSLKKLLNEKKYTPEEKDNILVMTDMDGLVWMEGEGPATGKEIDLSTKRAIRFYDMTNDGGQNA